MTSASNDRSGLPDVVEILRKAGRIAVIMTGYAAPRDGEKFQDASLIGNAMARFLSAMRSRALREHVLFYRDYYANPRSDQYMLQRLYELGSTCSFSALLVPEAAIIPSEVLPFFSRVRRIEPLSFWRRENLLDLRAGHDAILLVHSDPLGLGLGTLERQLQRLFGEQLFVLNGRRRLYRLDSRMRRILARRRLLAHTRIIEAILGRLVPVIGGVFAVLDRVTARRTS